MPDIPPYYTDISGTFNLQRNFIGNLAPSPGTDSIVSGISTNLNTLFSNFISSGNTADDVLTQQSNMMNIVQTEQDRLNRKKDDIESAYIGKQRAVQLNESYRLKYRQFMKILLVIIVTLVLFIMMTFLSARFPFIPSFIFEMISIFIISAGLFIIYFMITNLLSRRNTYYNELNIPGPISGGSGSSTTARTGTSNIQDLFADINLNQCIGSSCCKDGTRWDAGNTSCIGNTISGFTTIQLSYDRSLVKANSPNEFEDYTVVK
jgi:hypothetical protein